MLRALPLLALSMLFGCELPLSGLDAECQDSVESCDGTDEDCDGNIDEGVVRDCGEPGTCIEGTQRCEAGAWLACDLRTDFPAEECGGGDEDCDNAIDEGCGCMPEGDTRPCGNTEGECVAGEQTCTAALWGQCIGGVGPSLELCDRAMLDENCNGVPNESCMCTEGDTQPCRENNCEGVQTCNVYGDYGACVPNDSGPEVCNGIDDDCDGIIDNDATADCATATDGCAVRRLNGATYLLCYQQPAGGTDHRKSYDEARRFCEGLGYHLVTIDDGNENDFLAAQMDPLDSGDWWIGYNDRDGDGTYSWEFGASSFTSDGGAVKAGDCAGLDSENGDWNDFNCGGAKRFACEAVP